VNKGELIDKVVNKIDCTKVETKIIAECIFKNITDSEE
jgi:nucleoid DNA-binding protein